MVAIEGPSSEVSQGPTWQEQYDLGVRYLSEGNYQEAILAFTAAIEIDAKRAPAYVGRGDAYVGSGETEENLTVAKADYEKAIELDETCAEAYLGLADVYIRQGDYEKALEVLQQGLEKTGNDQLILEKIKEIETEFVSDNMESWGNVNYNDLSSEQQQLVSGLVEAVEQCNWERAWTLLQESNCQPDHVLSFVFRKYRIELSNIKSIEIHPQEGTGFYCGYSHPDATDDTDTYTYVVGECWNWNWNGTFEYCQNRIGKIYYDSDIFGKTIHKKTGATKNGLLDGVVIISYYTQIPNGTSALPS